ncbi:MAG TPA: response regulator [Thermoanaerobaculia bacterium]|nr:response regulator [Thermoanaerobaculia bacterium]
MSRSDHPPHPRAFDPELRELVPVFVEEARDRLERLATLASRMPGDEASRDAVKRELHTIKGAARMLQLGPIAELAHATEELVTATPAGLARSLTRAVDRLSEMVDSVAAGEAPEGEPALPADGTGGTDGGVRVDAAALDAVADGATQVRIHALAARASVQRIYELARLSEEGLREEQPRQILAVLGTMIRRLAVDVESGHRRLLRAAEDGLERLLALQLQPLRGSLLQLARYARELARSLGREVEVRIEGEETRLDRRIARELEESLLHLVRNAVDHGIEPAREREARGKPAAGTLRLTAQAAAGRVRLTISDDGAGIDPGEVVRQAVQAGLVEVGAAESLTPEEAFRLLFTPGFSTRRQVSEISGRGVGLDVVAAAVNSVGGEVSLAAEPGAGTTVVVEVPVARRGEEVLLVRVGRTRFALPSAPIHEVVRIEAAEIRERDGRSFAQIGDRLVPFVPLARLFGQPVPERPLLLIGRVSGQPLAVAVDGVDGEEEVLVRPVTRAVAVERVLDGMALLASGEPIGVLSPAVLAGGELLDARRSARPAEAARERVKVLLVEDSLVTREMERRLLEDAGFEVTGAADADEGLSYLGEGRFDCLVIDIEMPGMDGYALTRHLREIPRFAHLPIIVVSTRDLPEDRLQGLQAGADAYLTKQGLDAGELVDLVRRLSGTR